ncbi:HNH endonuclease [Amycolatopsis coloradensis]|uniref:HNH endonuclease n=1 Tax=Amycolatopsis coloradensis TaxID=76021 RepID=A0A1R0KDR1_9PSEU|nr:HNH endonuclease signature motif containing protein [Amycolatopsis coloradensis]OLZ43029.1 HNH endonuclease [Amycolatopsis coloradensis]
METTQAAIAALKDLSDSTNLEEINALLNSLDDKDSIFVAREATAALARWEAVRYRALSRLSELRGGARSVVQEVAMTLSLVDNFAGSLVSTGVALTSRLPRTLSLLDRGLVGGYSAQKVAEATAWLSHEDSLVVDAKLESRLPKKNSTQVRKAANYAANKADPVGAGKRSKQSRDGRRLAVAQGEAGVASIEVVDGQAEKVNAAYRRIHQEAKALKNHGDTRTMNQLRADIALDLLLSGKGGAAERAEVFLYMDMFTYLGLNDDPVKMAGHGHIPASLGRHIATGPNTVLRRIITDPLSGQVQDLGRTQYRPDAAMAEFVRVRDRECRRPGCDRPAQACELDHSIPWQFQGETSVADLITYCTRDHRLKDEPGWVYHLAPDGTLRITTPTGLTHVSEPPPLHEPRPEPPL